MQNQRESMEIPQNWVFFILYIVVLQNSDLSMHVQVYLHTANVNFKILLSSLHQVMYVK